MPFPLDGGAAGLVRGDKVTPSSCGSVSIKPNQELRPVFQKEENYLPKITQLCFKS